MEILNEYVNTVTLSGQVLPIRCDLYVLEQIQERYENLEDFEYRLMGFVPSRDEFGDVIINEKGNTEGRFTTPDIKVLGDALHMMVNEALEYAGAETMGEKKLKQMVDIPVSELSRKLHDEYLNCFKRKNLPAMQNQEETPKE